MTEIYKRKFVWQETDKFAHVLTVLLDRVSFSILHVTKLRAHMFPKLENRTLTMLLVGGGIMTCSLLWVCLHGRHESVHVDMTPVNTQLATDTLTQYQAAKNSGSAANACRLSGALAAMASQMKDDAGYQRWKETQKADCQAAGVSIP